MKQTSGIVQIYFLLIFFCRISVATVFHLSHDCCLFFVSVLTVRRWKFQHCLQCDTGCEPDLTHICLLYSALRKINDYDEHVTVASPHVNHHFHDSSCNPCLWQISLHSASAHYVRTLETSAQLSWVSADSHGKHSEVSCSTQEQNVFDASPVRNESPGCFFMSCFLSKIGLLHCEACLCDHAV